MNVLITVSSITQGSGLSNYILNLSKILVNSNWNVCVLTTHSIDVQYESETLKDCGVNHYVSFGSKSRLSKYLSVWRYINKNKPDIIINNYNAVIQFLLPFISHTIKVVHILHSTTSEFYRVATINSKFVDGWIAPTTAMVNDFNKYTKFQYKDKINVIPHGVNTVNKSVEIENRLVKNLVFVGVLYEHKGAHLLPFIIKKLKEKGDNFHFTIIGGGVLKDKLETELSEDIRNGLVTMTGVITSQSVYSILSQSDIFVYPTHIDAFGLVIAEAMMNSVVPVVTLLPGITDNLIASGKEGFLLEQDDVDGFVNKISTLLHDDVLLHNLKIAARKKALSSFSLEVMQKNYTKYLQNL